jgi:hypothetical protein
MPRNVYLDELAGDDDRNDGMQFESVQVLGQVASYRGYYTPEPGTCLRFAVRWSGKNAPENEATAAWWKPEGWLDLLTWHGRDVPAPGGQAPFSPLHFNIAVDALIVECMFLVGQAATHHQRSPASPEARPSV